MIFCPTCPQLEVKSNTYIKLKHLDLRWETNNSYIARNIQEVGVVEVIWKILVMKKAPSARHLTVLPFSISARRSSQCMGVAKSPGSSRVARKKSLQAVKCIGKKKGHRFSHLFFSVVLHVDIDTHLFYCKNKLHKNCKSIYQQSTL